MAGESTPPPTLWLPQTKLQAPRLRGDLISRSRLLDTLREAVTSRRLTLVSAPAGYGKTTLLTAFAQLDEKDLRRSSFQNRLAVRHRSLRAAIDYSWKLLSPHEQQVMRQLAVFRGAFDVKPQSE